MQTINIKLGIGAYVGIIFLLSLFVAIYLKDYIIQSVLASTGQDQMVQAQQASDKTATILLSIGKISFDTTVLNSSYLQTLTTFPSFPIDFETLENFGKLNPFIGSFIVVPTTASTSVGAVIYSNQRGANNGNSIVPVSPTRR